MWDEWLTPGSAVQSWDQLYKAGLSCTKPGPASCTLYRTAMLIFRARKAEGVVLGKV